MKLYHPPSGLSRGLDFLVDADWTPAQALAVIELLDDLRDRIWARYELPLLELLQQERFTHNEADTSGCTHDGLTDEPPF